MYNIKSLFASFPIDGFRILAVEGADNAKLIALSLLGHRAPGNVMAPHY